MTAIEKAADTIRRYGLLKPGDRVVVGVSGGADSLALLHMLCALSAKEGYAVTAAHVNHGLRGEEAAQDERHVADLCRDWGVELKTLHADVAREAAENGESLEQAGRRVRYRFFEQIAQPLGAGIATAHTLTDSVETMLLNLTRGTGLKGLCGIPPRRGGIVRPLIGLTRAETEEYCRENAIQYRNDSTNESRDFARNRIRMDVLPVLRGINPAFERSAGRAVENLTRDEGVLERLTEEALAAARREGGFDVQALLGAGPGLVRRVLSAAAAEGTGRVQEAQGIEKLLAVLRAGCGAVQLTGGLVARVRGGTLVFCEAEPSAGRPFSLPLTEGRIEIPCGTIAVTVLFRKEIEKIKIINNLYFKNMIDCDKIGNKAVLRSRTPGDRFSPAGRGVGKTLKKLFNEEKIPPERRDGIPVLADDAGVLWVAGFGPDERCRVTEKTERAFFLKTDDMGGTGFV